MESVKVWPKVARQSQISAKSYASAKLKGVRGLSSDVVLLGAGDCQMVEATNIFLTASDQSATNLIAESSPYTRIVWKPHFDHLTTKVMEKMYPPVVLSDDAVIPSLNHLALHQLIHFKVTNPDVFENGSQHPHLQRLLDWTTQKIILAQADPTSDAQNITGYTDSFRAEEIERLSAVLKPQSSEARLMCHLYQNLSAIYSGEKTGIQVALQDNLLLDNYETGQVYREGNRRLASAVALLAHQNPSLRILEVGGGTGSATNEVLPALKGDSAWRQYLEYRFTDTTTSFLAGAEERFSSFGGMTFGAFDMERSGESQGYQQDWDVVVASNVIHATSDIKSTLLNIRSILKPGGKMMLLELTQSQLSAGLVLGTFSDFWKAEHDPNYPRYDGPFLSKSLWATVLADAGFEGLDFYLDDYAGNNVSATVICATASHHETVIPRSIQSHGQEGVTMVYRHAPATFIESMANHIKIAQGISIDILPLREIDTARYRRFIFLLETTEPFFIDVTPQEWKDLQSALKFATSSLWLTKGDLMTGKEPLYAMIAGLAKGFKTEDNSIRFSTLDLDEAPHDSQTEIFTLVGQLESSVSSKTGIDHDSEWRYKDGVLYVSRLTPDDSLNRSSKALANSSAIEQVPLKDLKQTPLQIAIENPAC